MAIDPQAVNAAAQAVIGNARQLRELSAGMINKVAGDVHPHPDTIAALKAEAGPIRAEWITLSAALDAALTP